MSPMSIDTWLAYLGTVLLLMSTPGPSHLLMLSVSVTNGFRRSLATAAGDLTANAIQMTLAGLGLAAVLAATRYGFAIVKYCGVAYLVWLGVKQIVSSLGNSRRAVDAPPASASSLWMRGFVTSAANPKAVVFFAALFPLFIDSTQPVPPQVLVLGATYLVVDGLFLLAYGKGADVLRGFLRGSARAWVERFAGAALIAAAVLLGLKSVEPSR
jgi:threonine/homoserine/homoserine lactone efflux protein